MAQRFFNPAPQYFYSGTPAAPLSGGLMYFYEPGTSTPKDTYSDNGLSTPNPNPVVLSASGVLPNVFLNGAYRVILQDKDGVQQPGWPRDSVNSITDIAFSAWDSTITYGAGGANIVYASDTKYYISIQGNNTNHEPSANPLWWQPAFDYFAKGQTIVTAGYVAVGDATTGLTGISMVTKGGILAGDGTTAPQVLAVGTNGQVLTAASGQTTGLQWSSPATATTNIQEFPGSGTYTKPAGAVAVLVELWAGGGGGPNVTTSNTTLGGGAGGEYVRYLLDAADVAATEAVTIGAGGAGGANGGNNNGTVGGNTTFGSLLTAIGGNPGTTSANNAATIPRSNSALYTTTTGSNFLTFVVPQAGAGGNAAASSPNGMNAVMGGAGGGSSNTGLGGTSAGGGAGGNGNNVAATPATAGAVPSGGGGASGNDGGGGAGGNGYARITSW